MSPIRTAVVIAGEREEQWRKFMVFVDRHLQSNWIFRGVADAKNHSLVPKIGRDHGLYELPLEKIIFENFRGVRANS